MDGLLGLGLGYADWETHLKDQGYSWDESIKLAIIKRELTHFFKEEILQMIDEPNTAPRGRDIAKSNSARSIFRRLKGKTGEWEQRRQDRRLLGRDAK